MEPKDLITLDNDITYLIVDEYEYNEDKFYLSVAVDENNELDPDNIRILYAGEDEEGEFVEIVEDETVLTAIYSMMLVDYSIDKDPNIQEELIKEANKITNHGMLYMPVRKLAAKLMDRVKGTSDEEALKVAKMFFKETKNESTGELEEKEYQGCKYTILPDGKYCSIKIYAPKGYSFKNGIYEYNIFKNNPW